MLQKLTFLKERASGVLNMKELLYFSSSDLMIQVSYKKDLNSIHYFSHRELSFGERVVVEQYLLTNIAVKTEYYKKHPAMLNYIGVNSRLVKDLNQFHLKNTMSTVKEKDRDVDDTVKCLISQSMSNYYFEQIGDILVEMKDTSNSSNDDELFGLASRLTALVEAYNEHSENKVTIDELVPSELKGLFR